jgi:hypothetical protein
MSEHHEQEGPLGDSQMTPDTEPEDVHQPLQEALADIPPDRNTPLDGFVADSLLKKGSVTLDELLNAIDD